MTRLGWNVFIALALAVTGGLAAAASARADGPPTFKSGTELVTLNVAVTQPNAGFVTDLPPEAFEVFEDGVPQRVQFFSAGQLPLDAIVLIDMSASMHGLLPLVQEAAIGFVRKLGDDDRAAVMGISNALRVLQPFTSDKGALIRGIRATRADGGTPLYTALYVALAEFEREQRASAAPRRQAIVLLSDGIDTASTLPFDVLLDRVRRQGVAIYTIGPRPPAESRRLREQALGDSFARPDYVLRTLARETGGQAFFPEHVRQVSALYQEIAEELGSQYSLAYTPLSPASPGEFRRIHVRVQVPGVKWRTRTGYVADSAATSYR